jgi:hypothetical protein
MEYYWDTSFCTSLRNHRVNWSLSLVSLHDHFSYCVVWAEPQNLACRVSTRISTIVLPQCRCVFESVVRDLLSTSVKPISWHLLTPWH